MLYQPDANDALSVFREVAYETRYVPTPDPRSRLGAFSCFIFLAVTSTNAFANHSQNFE